MRKYAAWLPNSSGELSELYSIANGIYEAYDLFLENQNLWFDPVLKGEENLRYSVTLYHANIEVNFGNMSKPIEAAEQVTLVGTYGQLEAAFKIKYESEDPDGRWDIAVDEV